MDREAVKGNEESMTDAAASEGDAGGECCRYAGTETRMTPSGVGDEVKANFREEADAAASEGNAGGECCR
jgi:hypothetical protein